MTSKNIPADIKSKSIKETKEEINKILEKIEKDDTNLESHTGDYDMLLKLNKHMDELFKKKLKEINSLDKKNVKK
jgi:exonuclease VII small subunit|tara:strand:+ start:324 stop:548 length:225 start_codon:yes stop_codon:yes gene_type:complete